MTHRTSADDHPLILIVEDDADIRGFVRTALEGAGCRVLEAASAGEAVTHLRRQLPRLLLLDLGLPDRDGVHFLADLRTWCAVPVIVVSARDREDDKIRALDAGADDYLTKPFGVGELLARTRALLRRRIPDAEAGAVITYDDIIIDMAAHTVTRNGLQVHLTKTELRLLAMLVRNAGRVLTHRQLLKEVWGPAFVDSPHYTRVYVARLREKLEDDATRPRHIITETGIGYRFTP